MKLFLLSLMLVLVFAPIQAQDLMFSGTVRSANTGLPLSYVNIGIRKKNIGTASDSKGNFNLRISKEHLQDSLTFSAIGFQEVTLPVQALGAKPLELTLKEKVTTLQEVVVKSKKMRLKKLGITGRFPGVWGVPDKNEEGKDIYEFANLIELNGKPAEILSAHFYLTSPTLDSALFRINFYRNNNGIPGERIVEKNIMQNLSTKDGWTSINLSTHNIYLSEDFFMGVEYLPSEGADRLAISLGGKILGTVFSKKSSLGEWSKIAGVSLSSYVTARQ